MDIQKSGCILGYPLFIVGYPKIELWIASNQLIFGYPKMYFKISINRYLDIQKMNYGYPNIHFWMSKNEFWVSINRE